ncbi:protein 3A [Soybean ilarvirus I]|uniref:Movement protein n=1 Tax=Soybean ilarvirus I TaxID=2982525 RepID=A0A977XFQ2_9BROM|nr:protein 3A [Soybean ilarvirus I]
MAITPKRTALVFSADDEASLEKSVADALSQCVELNMGIRRCSAFPAVNQGYFLCELTTKETGSILRTFTDKVASRMFVDHAIIHLLYVPAILESTYATAELKLKYSATGDELYGGTKVNLNEAFVLTMSWPRSLFSEDVKNHKGLYLGGSIHCASTVPHMAKIGMWYPMWTEKLSNKQLYQKTVAVTSTKAIQTFARKMISSDKEMRSLLRSKISMDRAAKTQENPVSCSGSVNLLDNTVVGVDFTVKPLNEVPTIGTVRTSDVLVTKESTASQPKDLKEQVVRERNPERLLN